MLAAMAPDDQASCERLWLDWQQGDGAAFTALYARISPGLFALCRALTVRSRIAPEDLFQEAFRRAIAAAGRFRPEGSLEAWLAVIARRTAIDLRREAERRLGSAAPPVADPPDPASAEGRNRVDLLDALARLPEDLREVLLLRELQGLEVKEVAAWLGLSPMTVKRRTAEALRRLDGNRGP